MTKSRHIKTFKISFEVEALLFKTSPEHFMEEFKEGLNAYLATEVSVRNGPICFYPDVHISEISPPKETI